MHRPTILAAAIWFGLGAMGQVPHWTETATETTWHGQYSNCDMGYAVELPESVVAHASLPPSPNHGFLISISDPGTVGEVTLENQRRLVDVYDQYDALMLRSARGYLDWELRQIPKKEILQLREVMFDGLRAVEVRYRADASECSELVIYRKGIVYVLALRTTVQDFGADSALFARIRAGFHLLPLPKGACSNR